LPLIASVFGIDPDFKFVEMVQDGRLVHLDGKWRIELNKAHPQVRSRFSIAHEISHKAILSSKSAVPKERTAHNTNLETDEEESICNLFALLLLGLRPNAVRSAVNDRGFSLATVDFLTQRLEVSFEATIRAISHYADSRAAFLYCLPASIDDAELFYVQRYYATPTFAITISGRLTLPPFNCLSRAWNGQSTAKTVEQWKIEHHTHSCILEARRMPIYAGDLREEGLVVAVVVQ
jgi:hypothetical protein